MNDATQWVASRISAFARHFLRWSFCLILTTQLYAQSFNVAIIGSAGVVGPGSVQEYTLSIDNPSSGATLSNIRLNLSLGAGLELVDPAAIGCTNATGVQICNTLASLGPLQTYTHNFQLRMPASLSSPPQESFGIAYSASANGETASGGSLAVVVSVARNLASSGSANPSPVNPVAALPMR